MRVYIDGGNDYLYNVIRKRVSDSGWEVNCINSSKFEGLDNFVGDSKEEFYAVLLNRISEKISVYNDIKQSLSGILSFAQAVSDLEIYKESIAGVIYLSDISIYGSPKYVPVDETHSLDPRDGLSLVHNICEKIIDGFYRKYNIPTVVFRCPYIIGSAYGYCNREDSQDYIDSNIFFKILRLITSENKQLSVGLYNNQLHENTYLHVSDLANAINRCIEVMEIDRTCGIINLGSEISNVTGKEMCEAFEKVYGCHILMNKIDKEFAPNYSSICYDKAKAVLNPWTSKWTLLESIQILKNDSNKK